MSTTIFFEDLKVGQTASLGKTITEADILLYSAVSMDTNPAHLDEEAASKTVFGGRIAHGMLSAGLISRRAGHPAAWPGHDLYGPDAAIRGPSQDRRHRDGDRRDHHLNPEKKRATLKTTCTVARQGGDRGRGLGEVPLARRMLLSSRLAGPAGGRAGRLGAVGNFDGGRTWATPRVAGPRRARPDAPLAVLTFEPHPREYFRPDDPPYPADPGAERAEALAALGVAPVVRTAVQPRIQPDPRRGVRLRRAA